MSAQAPPRIITTDIDEPPNSSTAPGAPLADYDRPPVTPPHDASNHLSPGGQAGAVPPSPTLTNTSSVKFDTSSPSSPVHPTSLALRDNNPTAASGLATLGVAPGSGGTHRRMSSVATWSTAEFDEEGNRNPAFAPLPEKERLAAEMSWREKRAEKKKLAEDESDEKKRAKEEAKNKSAHIDPDADTTDPTPFKDKPSRLAMLVDPKSLADLEKIGGVSGMLDGLGVNGVKGLNTEAGAGAQGNGAQWTADLEKRKEVYGKNELPKRKSKSLFLLMWMALKDKVLILLLIAATVSLALGLYQTLGTGEHLVVSPECPPPGCPEPKVDWIEGVAILAAVAIVVLVGSVNDYQKELQFKRLNEKREDRTMKVMRAGKEQVINTKEVVVGDIAMLEPGEILPVDGVFLRGHNVRCDESGATGESDAIRKSPYDECIAERDAAKPGAKLKKDCFLVSGAKVLEGVGEYVVTAVGQNSFNGRILMAMQGEAENTPLQLKLNNLAELIAKCGAAAGSLLFVALMIRFFIELGTNPNRSADDKAQQFIQILIISVTLIVVAIPEGLPLAVTLALAFATKRMTKQNLLVRMLGSCETMANATVVCTDKTGTLTQNVMSVVAGSLGVRGKFVASFAENADRSNANNVDGQSIRDDFAFDMTELNSVASPQLQNLFNESIAINSTAFEDKNPDGVVEFVGSKTETALLRFAKEQGWQDYRRARENAQVVQMIPFSSEMKAMGVVVKHGNKWRLYVKGASEILTKNCTTHVVVRNKDEGGGATQASSSDTLADVETTAFTEESTANISKTIIFYASQTLRTLAMCYRDFESWPPKGIDLNDADEVPFNAIAKDLTLIAVTGIEDPLRPGVRKAVEECQHAGVSVKMCTGDNVLTARSIANQCGIFTPGGIIMEGPVFRKLNDTERLEVVPRLQILARSSPEDKRLLVKTLKGMGEVVGVTGDGTNDGPALKLANVGFSMGIAGTEVAKEASDIIIMDDAFPNIVLAIMWGRCVNDSVRKFLQFQISVNIVAVVVTFVSAIASDNEGAILTPVQLLWVNLIMDTFAALALATDPATRSSLDRQPDRLSAPLINVDMVKMIIFQAIYQIILCFVLYWQGLRILGLQDSIAARSELSTLIFNCFVFCQIFNQINCRRLDRKFNVFEGFFRNYYFMAIFAIMCGGQAIIVEFGGPAFQVTSINGRDWAISIITGLMAFPIGALVRLLPTEPFYRFLIKVKVYQDPSTLPLTTDLEEVVADEKDHAQYEYNPALSKIKDNLNTFANIRGGRVRASAFVSRSRHSKLRKADIQLPSILAMVPTVIAGTVAAGSHWAQPLFPREAFGNPAAMDPSRSTAELFSGKVQMHPDTDPNDPLIKKYGLARGD